MIVQRKNISFKVAESYHSDFWRKFNSGTWEPESFDFLDTFLEDNGLLIDVGCFIGPLTLYAARKGANVVALDPDPLAYEELMKNLALNPGLASKITSANVAISKADGKQTLYARSTYGSSSSSLVGRVRDHISDSVVSVTRLDRFFDLNKIDQANILKVDIEGGEYEIIDQLVTLKAAKKYKNLMLSLHYDQLNEAIYHKKIKRKTGSLVLMKLERLTRLYLFKKELLNILETVSPLFKEFSYIYNEKGHRLSASECNPEYLLQNKADLFFADEEWSYSADSSEEQ